MNHVKSGLLAVSCVLLGNDVMAQGHQKAGKDFSFSVEALNKLPLSSISVLDDQQFVFNNQLALADWDSIFTIYVPHLLTHQETIMHWAGYYGINPKLLISLIQMKGKNQLAINAKSTGSPLDALSHETVFGAQVKDIAARLSTRFYAYKKLEKGIVPTDKTLDKMQVSTSAASVALASVLSMPEAAKSAKKQQLNGQFAVADLLNAYASTFAEEQTALLQTTQKRAQQQDTQKHSARAAIPNLYLPWTSGWSWRSSGGAHGFDGNSWPLSSLDFYYPSNNSGWGGNKPYVYSAHGGTVTWLSRCQMRVTHASGIATSYYHMDNLQYASGAYINAGTFIGRYANTQSAALCEGGSSSGPHLHISLIKNGYWESLQGYNFSGYYVQVGSTNYDQNCSRSYLWKNGTTYCHDSNIYKPYE